METIAPPLGSSDLGGLIPADTPHKGRLFPQPVLEDGRLLDDVVGFNPALIVRGALPRHVAATVPVVECTDGSALAAVLAGLGVNAVLVRPDRYIAASARTKADVAALAAWEMPSPVPGRASGEGY